MSVFKEKDEALRNFFKQHFKDDDDTTDSENEEANEEKDLSLPTESINDPGRKHESEQLIASPNKKAKLEDNASSLDEPEEILGVIDCSDTHEVVDCTGDDNQVITIDDDEDEDDVVTTTSTLNRIEDELLSPIEYLPNDSSQLDVDDDFNLKLTIAGEYKQFKTTYKTPIQDALQELLSDLRKQGKGLVLTLRDVHIDLAQSPSSLELNPGSILRGTPVTGMTEEVRESPMETSLDPDEITLKVQDGNLRHTKEFKIRKDAQFISLKEIYAKQFNIENLAKLSLMFDGDEIADEETPEELDIDDGFMIDVIIKG